MKPGPAEGMLAAVRHGYERFLEGVAVLLLTGLALIVIIGVIFRYSGHALPWYDEVASVMLAWLTYYSAGLAAIKRAHIAIPGVVNALPKPLRLLCAVVAEICVFAFLGLMAWYGWVVLGLLAGETLVTVNIPVTITQSCIPIGSGLFILAELLALPEVFRQALRPAAGPGPEQTALPADGAEQ